MESAAQCSCCLEALCGCVPSLATVNWLAQEEAMDPEGFHNPVQCSGGGRKGKAVQSEYQEDRTTCSRLYCNWLVCCSHPSPPMLPSSSSSSSSSVPAGALPNSTVPSCKANKTCIPTIEEYDNVHEGVPPMKQYNWPECDGP